MFCNKLRLEGEKMRSCSESNQLKHGHPYFESIDVDLHHYISQYFVYSGI